MMTILNEKFTGLTDSFLLQPYDVTLVNTNNTYYAQHQERRHQTGSV
jgi:hypothetical protein